jgi:hypothetical protein
MNIAHPCSLPSVLLTVAGLASPVPAQAQRQPLSTLREAVACVQNALGGTRAIAEVKSLRMTMTTQPPPGSHGGVHGQHEIALAFPDRYKDVETSYFVAPDGSRYPLPTTTWGVDGAQSLSRVDGRPSPATAGERLVAQADFARRALAMLVRVPATSGARLSRGQATASNDGTAAFAIQMNGRDDLNGTLEIDAATCQPRTLQWTRKATIGDAMREARSRPGPKPPAAQVMAAAAAAPPTGTRTVRVTLSDYRSFDGIRFPTTWQQSIEGAPVDEQHVTSIEVNPTFGAETFAP